MVLCTQGRWKLQNSLLAGLARAPLHKQSTFHFVHNMLSVTRSIAPNKWGHPQSHPGSSPSSLGLETATAKNLAWPNARTLGCEEVERELASQLEPQGIASICRRGHKRQYYLASYRDAINVGEKSRRMFNSFWVSGKEVVMAFYGDDLREGKPSFRNKHKLSCCTQMVKRAEFVTLLAHLGLHYRSRY